MIWALVIILGIALDQGTKMIIKSQMELFESVNVIDGFFDIFYVTNSGGAWSVLSDYTWVLTLISCLMVTFMIVYMLKTEDKMLKAIFSIVISGAVGNLIDRVLYGEVTDFLAFDIFGYDFPTFNVADICVVVGTFALIIYIIFFFDKIEAKRAERAALQAEEQREQAS